MGGDPVLCFWCCKREDRIARPTKLKSPYLLEVFALAPQLRPDQSVQAGTGKHRRAVRIRFDAGGGSLYICKGRILHHNALRCLVAGLIGYAKRRCGHYTAYALSIRPRGIGTPAILSSPPRSWRIL